MSRTSFDVIVIGAGAAGLAATDELLRAGRRVLLLEARDRIGGRIWTRREPDVAVPIELGAEFIHGHAAITRTLLQHAGAPVVDASDSHWSLRDGRLTQRAGFFGEIRQALAHTDVLTREDMSFAHLLERHLAGRLSPAARQWARMMAEGFDAADARRASARALAAEWTGDTLGDAPQSRPRAGYQALVAALTAGWSERPPRLLLQCPVRRLQWSKGKVEIAARWRGASFVARAPCALITLPLGVLQSAPGASGGVRFTPALEGKRDALKHLVSGPVVKLLLRFATPFWETRHGGRLRDASFFHTPHGAIPTFWTPAPARAPLLVAWAGGPRALRAGATPAALLRQALTSLATLFGQRPPLAEQLEACYYHDWQRDPFARGAYSYVTVGGSEARATLARPLAETLFFAGEACDTEGEGGTVTGALQSGVRAAHELLAAPRRRLALDSRRQVDAGAA